jgi:hypothetical protein
MKELDLVELKKIDQSIEDRIMTVENEPPIDIRRRYKTDGKRQIEKSRSKPMAVGVCSDFCLTINRILYSLVAKFKKL